MRAIDRHRSAFATLAFILLVVFLLISRLDFIALEDPYLGAAATVNNGTSVALTIEAFGDGEWIEIETIPANRVQAITADWHTEHSRTGRRGCTTGRIRALDPTGEEVASREEPLCYGDTWVIEAAGY